MNIQSNNINVNVSTPLRTGLGVKEKPIMPRLSELWEFGDKIELENKQNLIQKLVEMPEKREDRVEYARKLVENPDYPSVEQLDKTAEVLANLL